MFRSRWMPLCGLMHLVHVVLQISFFISYNLISNSGQSFNGEGQ